MPTPESTPTFFIIGAPKCGTTSLYYFLNQHRDICMSIPKEPRCIELQDQGEYKATYQAAFRHKSDEKLLGEASPTYLFVPYVARRLHRLNKYARLIVVLRDPIERAFSDWWMYYSTGIENNSFKDCVLRNLDRIKDEDRFEGYKGEIRWKNLVRTIAQKRRIEEPFYLDVGHYGKQLDRYFSLFSSKQIKVIRTNDLATNPNSTMQNLLDFLKVNPNVPLEINNRANTAMGHVPTPARWFFKAFQRARLSFLTPGFIKKTVRNHYRRHTGRPEIDKESYYLLKSHYQSDVLRLERLLNQKFYGWLNA